MKSDIAQPNTPADTRALVSQQRESEKCSGIVIGPPSLGDISSTELLAPTRFGKGVRVLCMTRPYDIAGEFSMDFSLDDIDEITLWTRARANIE